MSVGKNIKGKFMALLIKLKVMSECRNLNKALKNPKKYVARGLRDILEYGKNTEYGERYHFKQILEAPNDEELYKRYKENVPIINYTDITSYVDKMVKGDTDILFEGKPIMFFRTSGTSSKPKLLPASPKYLKNINIITSMMLKNFFKYDKNLLAGKIFTITGIPKEEELPNGYIIGSVSGYDSSNSPEFIQKIFSAPFIILEVKDYRARYYLLMRFSIAEDVRLIITANPTTVNELMKDVTINFDKYCDDIEKGTINKDLNIEPEIRAKLEKIAKPNPKRAQELRAMKKDGKPPLPKDYWPNFSVLTTWKCGNTKFFINEFKKIFPEQMHHIEFGYYASECRFGLVFNENDATSIYPHRVYMEFIHQDDLDKPNPKTYHIHELVKGNLYCPIITTISGLYRYNMNDLIVACDNYKNTPTIMMVQKINGIVSITGEKLSETQFIKAIEDMAKKHNQGINFFLGFANVLEKQYEVYIEFKDQKINAKQAQEFIDSVDEYLKTINVEYATKRDSLRLNKLVAHRLPKDAFVLYKNLLLKSGKYKDNQFKLMILNQNEFLREQASMIEIK